MMHHGKMYGSNSSGNPACTAYLQIVLSSPLAVVVLSILSITGWEPTAVSALLLLYEGFLILVCQWDPSLQLCVELELGAIRLLHSNVLVVKLGEGDAIVVVKDCWVRREGEDLRQW